MATSNGKQGGGSGGGAGLIAVTGAAGFVGRHVVGELLSRGYAVRALVRDRSKAKEALPKDARLTLVDGDVTSPEDVRGLLTGGGGVAACIHLVGIIREAGKGQTFERMHALSTRIVTEACQASNVTRYLHMSAMGVGPEGRSQYQKTKWAGEETVRRSGLDWTIFRPSLIHGVGGEFIRQMSDIASGEVPPYYFMPYFARSHVDMSVPAGPVTFESATIAPVAVEDVAWAFAQALETERAVGEIYNLAGSETMDWPTLLRAIRDHVPGSNKKLQPFFMPGKHAEMIAHGAKIFGLSSLLPYDLGQAIMAQEDNFAETGKVQEHLGLMPKPFRATLKQYAASI